MLDDKIILTGQQKAATEMPFKHRVSILTGKPGTGKTTTVNSILEAANSVNWIVRLAAPTGKAAKRMSETTGMTATTIHSLLQCDFENGVFNFHQNERNPLVGDLVVIDEASMITTELMNDLLRAIDTSVTRLLLVGDTGQLPSVGPGAVLRDMLNSDLIPHVELDIIHRNAGAIVEACAAIHAGRIYHQHTRLDLDAENPVNLVHIEMGNKTDLILTKIKTLVCDRMPARGFDPVWDVQVLSPVNEKGGLSCTSINKVLREALNPDHGELDEDAKHKVFRAGDKVINTKNMKTGNGGRGEGNYLVNGDIGQINEITKKYISVDFFYPDRRVQLSRSTNHLIHAYCITCHKFQGSESPVIILPVQHGFKHTDRPWIYTAISRAKQICVTIGDFNAIETMIRRTQGIDRKTRMKEEIIDRIERIEMEAELSI